MPLWVRGQQFIPTFVREGVRLVSRSVVGGGFMRLRGAFTGPESYLRLPGGWTVAAEGAGGLDLEGLYRLISGRPRRFDELLGAVGPNPYTFGLFVAARDGRTVVLSRTNADGVTTDYLVGVFEPAAPSLAAVSMRRYGPTSEYHIEVFGREGMLGVLKAHLEAWEELGRPGLNRLRVEAYPAGEVPEGEGSVVRRRW